MDGVQESGEILRAIGSLEKAVEKLSEDMGKICDFKDELLATRQEFSDYKEIRKGLPDQIISLTSRMEIQEREAKDRTDRVEALEKEVKTLKQWADKAFGVQLSLNVLILIVVIASPFIIWWLGAR
jgi:polyhydroxyalkanoate synthesis regulator phasin